jgi:hypothetical protein
MDEREFLESMKLDFDPDALGHQYREERDKRIGNDGNAQTTEG